MKTLEELVAKHLTTLTPDQRIEFIDTIMEGLCKSCGVYVGEGDCHCWNDE